MIIFDFVAIFFVSYICDGGGYFSNFIYFWIFVLYFFCSNWSKERTTKLRDDAGRECKEMCNVHKPFNRQFLMSRQIYFSFSWISSGKAILLLFSTTNDWLWYQRWSAIRSGRLSKWRIMNAENQVIEWLVAYDAGRNCLYWTLTGFKVQLIFSIVIWFSIIMFDLIVKLADCGRSEKVIVDVLSLYTSFVDAWKSPKRKMRTGCASILIVYETMKIIISHLNFSLKEMIQAKLKLFSL